MSVANSEKDNGANISPDLEWANVPSAARSLALVVHDPDAPHPNGFYHWLVVDIPTTITGIAKGAKFAPPARELNTDFGVPGYNGPCPPRGSGPHHYHFTLYAIAVEKLDIPTGAGPHEIASAIQAAALGQTTITGLYKRE